MNKEERKIYDKSYREKNKEKLRDYHKTWRDENKRKQIIPEIPKVIQPTYYKASEIMLKYGICRNTLTNWVKNNKIDIILTPSGRYLYIINDKKVAI